MQECIFIEMPPLDVYAQMAADETLINQNIGQNICMARFFNWDENDAFATFGYAQFEHSARAQIKTAGIQKYTRRPTGGGVVLHKDDLTFSLFFNRAGAVKPADIYSNLHGIIKDEFFKNGFTLASYDKASDYRPAPNGISSNCFTNPVADDLLAADGAKVLGGAIRRFGDAILYQGSLQIGGARFSGDCKKILQKAILKYFDAGYGAKRAENALLNEIYALAQNKYQTSEWIEKF
jgi:lipoate-protein ligase A